MRIDAGLQFGLLSSVFTYGTSTGGARETSAFGPDFALSLGGAVASTGAYSPPIAAIAPQQSLAAAPQSRRQERAERALIDQALGLSSERRNDEARELLGDYLDNHKTSAAATHALAQIEQSDRHYEKAEQLFRRAAALAPDQGYDIDADVANLLQKDDASALKQARRQLATPQQFESGLRLVRALTTRNPINAEPRVLLAESLIRSGEVVDGLVQCGLAVSTATRPQLEVIRGQLHHLAQRIPTSASVQRLYGQAQLRLNDFHGALESFEKAGSIDNNSSTYASFEALAHIGLGREALDRGDVNAALASFQRASDLDHGAPEVRAALAEGYVAQGESRLRSGSAATAVDDFQAAARELTGSTGNDALSERIARGAYDAGTVLAQRRAANNAEVGKEVDAFQVAHDLQPGNVTYKQKLADTRALLGDAHAAAGRLQEAAQAYKAAYQLFRGNTEYRNAAISAFLQHGQTQLDALSYDTAIGSLREAYQLDETNLTSRLTLAGAYNARGLNYRDQIDYVRAAADFRAALQLDSENAEYVANYNSVRQYG